MVRLTSPAVVLAPAFVASAFVFAAAAFAIPASAARRRARAGKAPPP